MELSEGAVFFLPYVLILLIVKLEELFKARLLEDDKYLKRLVKYMESLRNSSTSGLGSPSNDNCGLSNASPEGRSLLFQFLLELDCYEQYLQKFAILQDRVHHVDTHTLQTQIVDRSKKIETIKAEINKEIQKIDLEKAKIVRKKELTELAEKILKYPNKAIMQEYLSKCIFRPMIA